MKRPPPSKRYEQRPVFEELEKRLLLSADLPGMVVDPSLVGDAGDEPVVQVDYIHPEDAPQHADAKLLRELVFVDSGIEDADALVRDLQAQRPDGRDFDVFLLDSTRDGVDQITDVLDDYENLGAVHIISHGANASLQLGSTTLDQGSLASYEDAIASWGDALSEEADLLFYGCDLAAGAEGQSLVESLAKLTDADVAASSDLTGSALLGGDWDLEVASGQIETQVAFSQSVQQSWAQVMATQVDNTTNVGTTSSTVSFSHTTSGNSRLMLVAVSMNGGQAGDASMVTSITYGADALTFLGAEEDVNQQGRVEIWQLVAPDTGSNTLTVNFDDVNSTGAVVGVTTFTNVDQANPTGLLASANGNSGLASVDVASEVGDVVFSAVTTGGADLTLNEGAGQSEVWERFETGVDSAGSTLDATSTSENVSWSFSSNLWAMAGVSVHSVDAPDSSILISTAGAGNTPDYSWNNGDVLRLSDPNLLAEPGTSTATFSTVFNIQNFDGGAKVDAMHLVQTETTVGGANAVTLMPGDLILSTDANQVLASLNTLSVQAGDVFVFSPSATGDYSEGTFTYLLQGDAKDGSPIPRKIQGIALVESETDVGDATLMPGTFLFSTDGANEGKRVYQFDPTDVGYQTTSGTVSILIEGNEINFDGIKIEGLTLVETDRYLGDTLLEAGQILLAFDSDDGTVGDAPTISVTRRDVFLLDV